jgi:hypothetical protein
MIARLMRKLTQPQHNGLLRPTGLPRIKNTLGGRKRAAEEPVASQPPPSPPKPACPIKGNVTSKGDRIYHKPGDRDYDRVVMKNCDHDMCAKGKRWFCSDAEAEAARWRHALR